MRIIALLIALAGVGFAQGGPATAANRFINYLTLPATCQAGAVLEVGTTTRAYYTCPAGTPVAFGTGAGSMGSVAITATANQTAISGTCSSSTSINCAIALAASLDLTGKTRTAVFKSGTTPPATCTIGDEFFDTDTTAGSNFLGCTATNTWTAQGAGGCAASATQVCVGPTGAGSNGLLYNSSATQLIVGPSALSFVADDPINDAPGSTLLPFVVYGKPTIASNYDYYLSAIQLYPVLGTGSYVDGLDFRIQPSSGTNAYLDGIRVLVNAGATTTPQTIRAMTLGNTGGTLSKAIEMAASASTGGTAYGGHITSVIADGGTAYGWSIQNVGFGGDPTLGIGLDIGDVAGITKLAIRTGVGKVQHADVLLLSGDVVNPFQTVKNTQSATAPGVNVCDVRFIAGTNGGTGKIVAACGTSATEVVIADNIGGGL